MKLYEILILFILLAGMVYATPGTNDVKGPKTLSVMSIGGLQPLDSEIGKISWSIDGLGITTTSGNLRVLKPVGATVKKAFFMAASTGTSGYHITDTDVTLGGQPINFTTEISNSIGSFNYVEDVTALVKPIIDAYPSGLNNIAVTEAVQSDIDGTVLVVIFNDPNQPTDNTIVLNFGAQNTAGDTFTLGLSNPIDKSKSGFSLDMSLGISYGYQTVDATNQFSLVNINGNRLTSSAGGQDDGQPANGALITVGGINDSNANPADANSAPVTGDRYDDELYSLVPLVNNGDKNISVFTQNPSSDDNIFFAGFFLGSTIGHQGGSDNILLTPPDAVNPLGKDHTVTATVEDAGLNPIQGVLVTFKVISGPNAGMTGTDNTDMNGQAKFTYTSNATGTDTIQASFLNEQQKKITSNEVTKQWVDIAQIPEFSVIGAFVALIAGTIILLYKRK